MAASNRLWWRECVANTRNHRVREPRGKAAAAMVFPLFRETLVREKGRGCQPKNTWRKVNRHAHRKSAAALTVNPLAVLSRHES